MKKLKLFLFLAVVVSLGATAVADVDMTTWIDNPSFEEPVMPDAGLYYGVERWLDIGVDAMLFELMDKTIQLVQLLWIKSFLIFQP